MVASDLEFTARVALVAGAQKDSEDHTAIGAIPEANIIVGAVVDERLEGEIHVTVIATGFEGGGSYRPERSVASFSSGANSSTEADQNGAAIPSFLLNRQRES